MVLLSALEQDFLTAIQGTARSGTDLLFIINTARAVSGINPLKVGSLYPTLHRMEAEGLIEQEPKPDRQRSDRSIYYRLSKLGITRLEQVQTYRDLLATARP